jgi:hypothetical protein
MAQRPPLGNEIAYIANTLVNRPGKSARLLSLGEFKLSWLVALCSVFIARLLDGGGIRGLSSLIILKEIMKEVKAAENRKKPQLVEDLPKPCQYFDMIGGTSTGG